MSDSGNVSRSSSGLYAPNIRIRTVKKSIEASVGINSAGTAMRMNTRVLIRVVVEPDGFSLRASEDWTLRAGNLGMDGIRTNLLFLGKDCESSHKLIKGDPASCSLLNFREGHIDVRGGELLVNQLGVLSHLGEALAIHSGLTGATVVRECLLKCFWRSVCLNHLSFVKS